MAKFPSVYQGTRVSSTRETDTDYAPLRDGLIDWLAEALALPFQTTGDEPCIQPDANPEDWYDNFGTLLREDGTRVPVTKSPAQKRTEAQRLCHGCPSLDTCLNAALEGSSQFGVWGGMTAEDRQALKRQRARSAHRPAR